MKVLSRVILPYQEKDFFLPIRDKVNYAWLILHSARALILNIDTSGMTASGLLKLIVDRMSRLFLYKDGKFFSVSFPFNVITNGNEVLSITTYSGSNVDNKLISQAISVLNNDQFKLHPSPIEYWINNDSGNSIGLSFLEEIFLFEPAYIRYDSDPTRENGRIHPLNHLDINYSSYGTYKVGLEQPIIDTYFENILNITTECSFITQ